MKYISRKKVLLICFHRYGGMTHYHAEVSNALSSYISTSVIYSNVVPKDYYAENINNFPVLVGNSRLKILLNSLNPLTYIKILMLIKRLKPDIIHFTSNHEWNVVIGVLLRIFYKTPIIFTLHDPHKHIGSWKLNEILQEIFLNLVNVAIVHSEKLMKFTGREISKVRIKIIPLISYSLFNKFKLKNVVEENIILFMGRIELYKGVEILLKAAPGIIQKLPSWKIIIAGKGSIREFNYNNKSKRIIINNEYLKDEELVKMIQKSKIVVLPFTSATQSGSVLLAQSFSKAVITTNVGALSELVIDGETGILIPPGNVKALEDAVVKLAQSESHREELGKAAFKRNSNIFNKEKIGKMHIELYESLIKNQK